MCHKVFVRITRVFLVDMRLHKNILDWLPGSLQLGTNSSRWHRDYVDRIALWKCSNPIAGWSLAVGPFSLRFQGKPAVFGAPKENLVFAALNFSFMVMYNV